MKSSLESLLEESLSGLKSLSQQITPEQQGPMEGMETITAEQINEDVLAHTKDERYGDLDHQQICQDFITQNDAEHSNLQSQISDIQSVVGNVISSMEMLSTIASMESVTSGDLDMANAAVANISNQYDTEAPPELVADGDSISEVSMEGLVDWVKKSLRAMKKWIVEMFQNMAMNQRRATVSQAALFERAIAVRNRMATLPADYGIPSKQVRYDPAYLFNLFVEGSVVPFEEKALSSMVHEVVTLAEFATDSIGKDAVSRSTTMADVVADILVARTELVAEEKLKDAFESITTPLPVDTYLNERKIRDREFGGGLLFVDPSRTYRSRYRDAAWIAKVMDMLEMNQVAASRRRTGAIPSGVLDLETIQLLIDRAGDIIDSQVISDHSFYNEIGAAWQEANKVYNRLITMVQNMDFPQMNNELWRALDVAVTAMFHILEKGFNHTTVLRRPMFHVASSLIYIAEEQVKAYTAVNR